MPPKKGRAPRSSGALGEEGQAPLSSELGTAEERRFHSTTGAGINLPAGLRHQIDADFTALRSQTNEQISRRDARKAKRGLKKQKRAAHFSKGSQNSAAPHLQSPDGQLDRQSEQDTKRRRKLQSTRDTGQKEDVRKRKASGAETALPSKKTKIAKKTKASDAAAQQDLDTAFPWMQGGGDDDDDDREIARLEKLIGKKKKSDNDGLDDIIGLSKRITARCKGNAARSDGDDDRWGEEDEAETEDEAEDVSGAAEADDGEDGWAEQDEDDDDDEDISMGERQPSKKTKIAKKTKASASTAKQDLDTAFPWMQDGGDDDDDDREIARLEKLIGKKKKSNNDGLDDIIGLSKRITARCKGNAARGDGGDDRWGEEDEAETEDEADVGMDEGDDGSSVSEKCDGDDDDDDDDDGSDGSEFEADGQHHSDDDDEEEEELADSSNGERGSKPAKVTIREGLTSKYVPPALRGSSTASSLRFVVRGYLNKLAPANIGSVQRNG